MEKKYELTDVTIKVNGYTLHRIMALKDFGNVKAGDIGGWIESEHNLSQEGNCWVYQEARVYEEARVSDGAKVYGEAKVFEDAQVYENAVVSGDIWIDGWAKVHGDVILDDSFGKLDIRGYADIKSNKDIEQDGERRKFVRV